MHNPKDIIVNAISIDISTVNPCSLAPFLLTLHEIHIKDPLLLKGFFGGCHLSH